MHVFAGRNGWKGELMTRNPRDRLIAAHAQIEAGR
jgi:hypothetical protein